MARPREHPDADDRLFKALSHGGRRRLLVELGARDGRTLGELSELLPHTRQAVGQHLDVLEGAGLITTRWHGREKLHFLNSVRLLEAYAEWMEPLITREARALAGLRERLREAAGASATEGSKAS